MIDKILIIINRKTLLIGAAALAYFQEQVKSGTISSEEYESLLLKEDKMRRKELLKKHTPPIKKLKNGRYYTRIEGKTIQSFSERYVEDKVIKYYLEGHSFKEIFEKSEDFYLSLKKNEDKIKSAEETKRVHVKIYNRFIKGTEFEKMDVRSISKKEIIDLLNASITKNNLKYKAFCNLKGILNKTFVFAQIRDLITVNPMTTVPWTLYQPENFAQSTSVRIRGYSIKEVGLMLDYTHIYQEEHPYDSRPWAYEFTILTGTRRGEVPALKWEDIDFENGYLYLCKQLIGHHPYHIKETAKRDTNRIFPVTSILNNFLLRLRKHNATYHPDSEFLFPNDKEPLGCMSLGGAYKIHEKACKALGIAIYKDIPKGTHAFRRVHETEFLDETGSLELSVRTYGHNEETIRNHYLLTSNAKKAAPAVSSIQQRIIDESENVHTRTQISDQKENREAL